MHISLLTIAAAASAIVLPYEAPLINANAGDLIPGHYIVVYKDGVSATEAEEHRASIDSHLMKRAQFALPDGFSEGIKHVYQFADSAFGYAGSFSDDLIAVIRADPRVAHVEQDSIVTISDDIQGNVDSEKTDVTEQTDAPWGLARISHRDPLTFGTFNKYVYNVHGGEGIYAFIVDTGSYLASKEFGDRGSWGATIPAGDPDEDGNGHGTHVAGTIASSSYGVAKKAKVVAVKVLRSNGSGTMSDVVKGVEYVATAHAKLVAEAKAGKRKGFKGSVANMSLGGGQSPTLDKAVNAAVKAGVHFAVAAGNEDADACTSSPARAELPVTVGASTIGDERAYFSNYGSCVDIFAPGLNIKSTWIGSPDAVNTISGTSMASPHVAGLLAYFSSLQPGADSAYFTDYLSPTDLKKKMISYGVYGALDNIPAGTKTPNILIFNGGKENLTENGLVPNGHNMLGETNGNVNREPVAGVKA
ncbi:hypothetical protein CANCADRAFT_65053 [Tortispora caseinolytica NRRL Y-17796]|uniref:Peptidase S8/S53 domain-containing protein n=1 Tax=Tortispora caseinolytica NRRL Y-17796 TaxID=767744 RepID=A0A1E4THC1_9ASCO|nr:hypothetical protein CANCADRAFT_65053 [Tortispora caseinolytica NRRL Y-17796]